jgi:hypothetical protein
MVLWQNVLVTPTTVDRQRLQFNPERFVFRLLSRNVEIGIYNAIILTVVLYGRLCGLVVRVLGYRSGSPGSIPGTTRFS